jgi:hypothetical protein
MKYCLTYLVLFLSVFSVSGCVRDQAEKVLKERISQVPPELFYGVNIKPRGDIFLVSFPSENRIGHAQLVVKGYKLGRPDKLEFYHPIPSIQGDIDQICTLNNIQQEDLLPLIHKKITSYLKVGASQVRGINSKTYIAFQYADELTLYYVADLPQNELDGLINSNNLKRINKSWLYKRYDSDILH